MYRPQFGHFRRVLGIFNLGWYVDRSLPRKHFLCALRCNPIHTSSPLSGFGPMWQYRPWRPLLFRLGPLPTPTILHRNV